MKLLLTAIIYLGILLSFTGCQKSPDKEKDPYQTGYDAGYQEGYEKGRSEAENGTDMQSRSNAGTSRQTGNSRIQTTPNTGIIDSIPVPKDIGLD